MKALTLIQPWASLAEKELSAIAAQNRRMREALERCRRMFGRMEDGELPDDPGDWASMCEEALKS